MYIMTTLVKSIILKESERSCILKSKLTPIFSKEIRKVTFATRPKIIIFNDDNENRINTFDLDKKHFQFRIQRIEKEIGWCLTPQHREKIYGRSTN